MLSAGLSDVAITPFGVNCEIFSPLREQSSIRESADLPRPIVIGTVKTLAHKYGIDVLIKAFSLAKLACAKADPAMVRGLTLRIVGGGEDEAALKVLVQNLEIDDAVTFVGNIPHSRVPDELRQMDIFVALSRLDSESFGVAAIEAGAVGLPVVVSDAGGLPEVVLQGKTGLVVPKDDPQAACDALIQLVFNPELRHQLGTAGRERVLANYSWDASLKTMVSVYERLIATHKTKMQIEK